ncbi:hypothetical protein BS47DRAFT_242981 [Hydnum rufescens UP504]|uniref:Uncharacterized protein n=1 Tax=Hydnum rufescens UP504 TaxID=1448309 RepID=A0A9P6AM13_9AGAM|nr:hypothetical protein BS47DRAFT_242981 [Hydnum rufescens UP504]
MIGLAGVSKWHSDLHSTAGLPQGISDDAMEEWERVKLEVGFTCSAIDQVLENSIVRGPRPPAKEPETRRRGSDDFLDAWTIITMFGVLSLLLLIALRFPAYGRALISRDRRMWNICNDISRAGIFESFGHANPNVAWSLVRRLQPGARRLGWVPT